MLTLKAFRTELEKILKFSLILTDISHHRPMSMVDPVLKLPQSLHFTRKKFLLLTRKSPTT